MVGWSEGLDVSVSKRAPGGGPTALRGWRRQRYGANTGDAMQDSATALILAWTNTIAIIINSY